jgi:hypothetical protein
MPRLSVGRAMLVAPWAAVPAAYLGGLLIVAVREPRNLATALSGPGTAMFFLGLVLLPLAYAAMYGIGWPLYRLFRLRRWLTGPRLICAGALVGLAVEPVAPLVWGGRPLDPAGLVFGAFLGAVVGWAFWALAICE